MTEPTRRPRGRARDLEREELLRQLAAMPAEVRAELYELVERAQ